MDRDVHVEQVGEAAGHRRRHAWYRIRRGGADADSFDIDARTGQIRTRTGITYDYERDETFSLNVVATDGDNADSIAVTIAVKDVNEPPSLPPSNLSVQPGDQSLTAHFHWLVPLRGAEGAAWANTTYYGVIALILIPFIISTLRQSRHLRQNP